MLLEGKIAIVTGGNSGIGKAIALGLAGAGANIVIDYVAHPEATDALEREISSLGDQSIGVEANVSRTAGVELAPHGMRVVGVGPGAVATPINLSTIQDATLMAKLNGAIPLGRMAEPDEIANVVVFLAGDGARYVTATTIFADGGIMQSSPGL